jgi:hypothetical protein
MFSVSVPVPAATIGTDFVIFVAPFDCTLQSASEVHAVLGTDASAVNVQLTHDTGTQAPGVGGDLLANSSNAGFNLKGTINTPQHASFKSGTSRKFVKGDRLSADFAGVMTAVAGVTITATFNRLD